MNRQSQWLFEAPFVLESDRVNLGHETSLAIEEMPSGNYYHFPLPEDEWEVSPPRHPTSRTRQPIGRQSGRQTARIPLRRAAMPHHQQRHSPVAQLHQPVSASQGPCAGAKPILIATIDRFESGSYLLKRRQLEQLQDLSLLLVANEDLGCQIKLGFIGHTDNEGGESGGNFQLAGQRAIEVENHIMRLFRSRNKFSTCDLVSSIGGEGPRKPIATNTTPDGKACNRRVEVFSNVPLKPIPKGWGPRSNVPKSC